MIISPSARYVLRRPKPVSLKGSDREMALNVPILTPTAIHSDHDS